MNKFQVFFFQIYKNERTKLELINLFIYLYFLINLKKLKNQFKKKLIQERHCIEYLNCYIKENERFKKKKILI